MRAWKQVEREIAKAIGGERVGILGREDVRHERYSIEVKTRKELPAFLAKAYAQTVKNCPKGKIPLLIIHQKHQQYADSLAVLRLKDLIGGKTKCMTEKNIKKNIEKKIKMELKNI